MSATDRVRLSVVIVAYDMDRALARTVRSLSADSQRGIDSSEYELIVVDNGSPKRPDEGALKEIASNVRLIALDGSTPSPAHALNVGAAQARGDVLGLMIDGSHMATPRALSLGLRVVSTIERAVALAPAFNLGWDAVQPFAVESGYDFGREEALLAGIDWQGDGYELFNVSAPVGINPDAWLGPFTESNLFFLSKHMWTESGGADEQFDLPGGGFALPDLVARALELPGAQCVTLLGEASFHQLHGDLKRRDPAAVGERRRVQLEQYTQLRGHPWTALDPASRIWFGRVSAAARPFLVRASTNPYFGSAKADAANPQLEPAIGDAIAGLDGTARAVATLAQRLYAARQYEAAAAVCRAARARLGDVPALMSILATTSPWLRFDPVTKHVRAQIHVALGEAMMLFDEREPAIAEFEAATELEPFVQGGPWGLAQARFPGPMYTDHLTSFHRHLRPRIYLEIGVDRGSTFVLAEPPTIAIGVDPSPHVQDQTHTESHLYETTSDEFFVNHAPTVLAGDRLDFAFIDGLHLYEQSLRDFANVEQFSHPGTVVVLHDTIPLNEATQQREMTAPYWTGDVWKLIVLLAERRPSLTLATIPTFPSGLTLIGNLDSTARLDDWADADTIRQYGAMDFSRSRARLEAAQQRIDNSWSAILDQLASMKSPVLAR